MAYVNDYCVGCELFFQVPMFQAWKKNGLWGEVFERGGGRHGSLCAVTELVDYGLKIASSATRHDS